MVANFNTDRTTEIIKALATIPQVWALTPVNGDKRPYKGNWQKQGLDRKEIESELKSGRAKGYGLLTGSFSGGLLAVDADGPAAHELLAKLGELPETVAFSSGKDGRCQYLLKVDESFWDVIKTVKLNTSVKGENGKNQLLEFRWNGCQSVLPPSVHPETGRYQWVNSPDSVEIAECPVWVIEAMMNAEDAPKPEPALPLNYSAQPHSTANRPENIPLPVPETILLKVCLAKSSRDLLDGISEGGRNDAGTALARDLIGTANYLNSIGQRFDGDPEMMLNDFAIRCSPSLPAREVKTIWKSASKANPSPACKSEGVDNCIRGWYWQNYLKNNRTVSSTKPGSISETNSNVVPLFPPMLFDLRTELTKLVKMGTAGSQLTEAIFSLAKGGNPQQVWRLYKEISEEIEDADQRADRKKEVENLLTIGKRRLTLENYLHPYLAEPIKKIAAWMVIDPEAVLTHLLPIAAGLINPKTRIIAKECINFSEPCLIYSGVVALSGGRKTPTLNIVKAPLVKLQGIEDARYEQALQRYEAEMQALKGVSRTEQSGGDEGPQKPNPPREFYLDNATVEAVDKVKGQQPDHGSTLVKDELSSLFASHGAYKGGKGADKESYLSGWNGGGVKKNRAGDGSRVSLSRDSLSITGGIQPDKLRELLGDFSDSQGEWARFLWYHMPMRPFKIPRDDTSYSLDGLLTDIYEKIDALPVLKLRFDKQGQTHFDDWHDEKDEQKRAETRPGLQAAIAKMPGQAVRLIGLLHILWEVASGSAEVPEEIPFSIIKSGCKLADFYLGQVTILQGDGDALNGELTPVLKVLLDKVNERGSLTATEAKKIIWAFRKVEPAKIRQYFNELAGMDLAVVQGSGSRLTLTPKISSVDEHQQLQNPISVRVPDNTTSKELRIVDELLMRRQQPESFIQQGIREIGYQTVDGVDVFSITGINTQSLKVEVEADASRLRVDIPNTCINTSISSTDGSQIPAQQECAAVDEISSTASTVEDSSTGSPPEPQTAPTTPETVSALLIERVQAAQTWADVESVWGGDLELKEKIKSQLTQDEYRRIGKLAGKLAKQALIDSPATEPIALPDNSQQPEPALEATSEAVLESTPAPEVAPAPEPTPVPPAPEFKVGDRVVIAKIGTFRRSNRDRLVGKFSGRYGVIEANTCTRREGFRYIVRFDKPNRNGPTCEFKPCELKAEGDAPC